MHRSCPQGKWAYSWVGYEGIKHILYHKNLCTLQGEIAWNCGKLLGVRRSLMPLVIVARVHCTFWKASSQWREFGCIWVRVIIRRSAGTRVMLRCSCVAALKSEPCLDHLCVCERPQTIDLTWLRCSIWTSIIIVVNYVIMREHASYNIVLIV